MHVSVPKCAETGRFSSIQQESRKLPAFSGTSSRRWDVMEAFLEADYILDSHCFRRRDGFALRASIFSPNFLSFFFFSSRVHLERPER